MLPTPPQDNTPPFRVPQGHFLDLSFFLAFPLLGLTFALIPLLPADCPILLRVLPQTLLPLTVVLLAACFCDRHISFQEKLPLRPPHPLPWKYAASMFLFLYVLTFLLSTAAGRIAELAGHPLPPQTVVTELLKAGPDVFFPVILSSVLLAPLTEEILFRHILFSRLSCIMSEGAAAVCSALLFAILHASLLHGLSLFCMGLILQAVYRRTRSLAVPILLHSAFNLTTALFLFFMKQ